MSDQQLPFVYTLLDHKLRERLDSGLSLISRLSKENVLECGNGCLTELVREFAVAPPIVRLDLRVADKEFGEAVDLTFERKTGGTNHIFLIPVERDAQWLEEINSQRVTGDGFPLAFLDKRRSWVSIRLTLSPEDPTGALNQKLEYRSSIVEQYADSSRNELSSSTRIWPRR